MPTPPPTSAGSGPPQPRTASPTTGALARCDRHRERFAEWLCAHCGKGWCDECGLVTRAVSSKVQLVQCPACRDRCVASPRRERRVQREQKANHDRLSIPWAIGEGAKRPFAGGYEIFVWLGIGFLYAVGSASAMYAGTMSIILRLLPVPFMLRIVRHAARGEPGREGCGVARVRPGRAGRPGPSVGPGSRRGRSTHGRWRRRRTLWRPRSRHILFWPRGWE